MYEVLDELGVRADLLAPQQLSELDELGYCRFDNFLVPAQISAALGTIEPLAPGTGTLRLTDLLETGPVFDPLWLRPNLLAAVRHLLGPEFRISAMTYRAGRPDHGQVRPGDAADRVGPVRWRVCTAIVALVDFTRENGATRVVPGSHLDYGFVPPPAHEDHPDQTLLVGQAGTAWLVNSHLWHSSTVNRSSSARHAVFTGFGRRCGTSGFDPRPADSAIERLGSAAYLLM
ncbi:phytanoyl-CoA dioxygenase family protein [Actinokineospora cianjurensis]|uniref:Phytanoyl-CoA dioxygenase PhyH n=1 Tax=Actinokineospora cianjurensis TaxID=585224 RepID=A0A421B8A9_9PSEU|nr:phytanoyl-CoA dioxygenase family protein [Actinokineospora cianjurensis]RLK60604.1 phytanoyl-CoA dioxygenase PhyH [Actinokineospora cianjurensis]